MSKIFVYMASIVLGSIAMVSLGVRVVNPINNAHTFILYGMHVVAIVLPE